MTDKLVGRITPTGNVILFPISRGSGPKGMTVGPDHALWFTLGFEIGRMTTAGQFTGFPLPEQRFASEIAAGADGNLWFIEPYGRIGRFTPAR